MTELNKYKGLFDDLEPETKQTTYKPSQFKGLFDDLEVESADAKIPTAQRWKPTFVESVQGMFGANKERASNELATRRIAGREGVSTSSVYESVGGHQPILNPEGRNPALALTEGAKVISQQAPDIIPSIENTALRAIRGGRDTATDESWLDREITATDTPAPQDADPNYGKLQGLGKSVGHSLTTMGASLAAGIPVSAVSTPAGGVAAGMAASGAVSFRGSKDEFLDNALKKMNADSMKLKDRPINQAEWEDAQDKLNAAANKYGAWEAIPEAVGNAVLLGTITKGLKGALIGQGSEQATETMTGVGQNRAEVEAGLTKEKIGIDEAWRNQALQTALLAGGMQAAVAGVQVAPAGIQAVGSRLNAAKNAVVSKINESKPNQEPPEATQNIYADQPQTERQGGLDMNAVVDRMIGAESAGKADAKNPYSSAEGLGQFIDSTWLKMVKKHRPDVANGKSDQEILDLKTNGALSREMTTRYAEDNMQELQSSGFEATGRNVYLAHHFGVGGARSLLRADPNVPVASVVSAQVIQQNPYMKGKTVGQVLDFIGNKMGEQAGSVSSAAGTGTPNSPILNNPIQSTPEVSQQEAPPAASTDTSSLTDAINPALQAGAEAVQDTQAPTDIPTEPVQPKTLTETVQDFIAPTIEAATAEVPQAEATVQAVSPVSQAEPMPVQAANESEPLVALSPPAPIESSPEGEAAPRAETPLFSVAANEAEQFRASLDKALTDRRSVDVPITVGRSPEVFKAVGIPDLPVVISRDTVRKATNGVKHNVPVEVVRNLPALLADPAMIFDSDSVAGAKVIAVESVDASGRPVIVALQVAQKARSNQLEVNRIASIYGRDNVQVMQSWVDKGLLRYAHKQKSQQWFQSGGLQLPNEGITAGTKTNVLTNEDIVKRSQQSPPAGRTRSGLSVSGLREELVAQFGAGRVKMLERAGRLRLVQSVKDLPKRVSAWHGSPYDFDEFTLGSIGSGEGKQAYGWGLYFAEKRKVAEWYRDTLATRRADFEGNPKGKALYGKDHDTAMWAWTQAEEELGATDSTNTADWLTEWLDNIPGGSTQSEIDSVKRVVRLLLDSQQSPFDNASSKRLYKVEIPTDGSYLLWDSALRDQPKKIKDALRNLDIPDEMAGADIYKSLAKKNGDKDASLALNRLGIKGIKYLDGNSRARGDGSYNYVIFDDNSVTLIEKFSRDQDGVAGMFDGDAVWMVADNIRQGEAWGVFLHEAGEHAGLEQMLGAEKYAFLVSSFDKLVESGNADALQAVERVPSDTPQQHVNSERLAYLIENFTNNTLKTGGAKNLARRVISALRAWALDKLPAWARPQELSPADIQALAVRAARSWANDSTRPAAEREVGTNEVMQYSIKSIAKAIISPNQQRNADGFLQMGRVIINEVIASPHQAIRDIGTPSARAIADLIRRPMENESSATQGALDDLNVATYARQGEFSKKLSGILEPLITKRTKLLVSFTIPKADREALVRGLHTGIVPTRLVPAAKQLRAWLDELRDYQEAAGLDFGYIKHYFPRVYDLKKVLNNQQGFTDMLQRHGYSPQVAGTILARIVNGDTLPEMTMNTTNRIIMAANGQTGSFTPREGGVAGSAGKSGHQQSRQLDIPYDELAPYLNNDLEAILTRYMGSAIKRAEYARRFGANEDDLNKLVASMVDEIDLGQRDKIGALNAQQAVSLVYDVADMMQGSFAQPMTRVGGVLTRSVLNLQVIIKLPLAVLSSMPEFLTPGLLAQSPSAHITALIQGVGAGVWEGMRAMDKMITGKHHFNQSAAYQQAEEIGVIAHAAIQDALDALNFAGDSSTDLLSLGTRKFMQLTLQEQTMRLQKTIAVRTFMHAVKQWAKSTQKADSEQLLKDFGIDLQEAQRWARAGFPDNDPIQFAINRGAIRFANTAVTTPDASVRSRGLQRKYLGLPLLWQFQSFSNAFGNTMLRRILVQQVRAKNARQLVIITGMIMMMAAAFAAQELRDWWKYGDNKPYKDDTKDDPLRRIFNSFDRAGFTGMFSRVFELISPYKFGYGQQGAARIAGLAGPTATDVGKVIDAFAVDQGSDKKQAEMQAKFITNMIPFASGLPYQVKQDYMVKPITETLH